MKQDSSKNKFNQFHLKIINIKNKFKKMVYGVIIFEIESASIFYTNYYFEEGNDIDKNTRT